MGTSLDPEKEAVLEQRLNLPTDGDSTICIQSTTRLSAPQSKQVSSTKDNTGANHEGTAFQMCRAIDLGQGKD